MPHYSVRYESRTGPIHAGEHFYDAETPDAARALLIANLRAEPPRNGQYIDTDLLDVQVRLVDYSKAATPLSDREALDRLALFMARPGQWNGGDVCDVAAELIAATGRPSFEDTDQENDDDDPSEATPAYAAALAAFHASTEG